MPMSMIGFRSAIEFSELERVFVELAPIVFEYFGKGGERTVATERCDGGDDYQESTYRRHTFVNEDITVEVLNEIKLHDNSMTSELLYRISMSVSMDVEILYMFNELTQPRLFKLYYRCDNMHKAFAAHYLANLQAKVNE